MPRFNRAYRGLYGNRMIQFGNKISFAENKTRRTWKPNVQKKTMFSETLQRKLTFRMTTYAMRCIRKAGGIDEYLMKTKDSEIKYDKAIAIKQELLAVRKAQRDSAEEVIALREEYSTRTGDKPSEDEPSGDEPSREQGPVDDHAKTNPESTPLRATSVTKFRSRGLLDLL